MSAAVEFAHQGPTISVQHSEDWLEKLPQDARFEQFLNYRLRLLV
jgi:hypothetical protein